MHFVVIEGLDGSGKSTQLNLLQKHLERESVPYRYLHFPRLEKGFYGKLIARFLRGELGTNDQVDPYLAALLFAGDRADAAQQIREWIKEGSLVIADRYVYSNIAFQCAKIDDTEKQKDLRDWILEFEYGYNAIPRPDVNLYLDVPASFIREQLYGDRQGFDRAYLKGARDIHEENPDFQEKVREIYHNLRDHVDDLVLVNCQDDRGGMLDPAAISEIILHHITLPQ
ncbi:MAG: dTMP kinase [Bacteroidales bacterium]